MVFSDSGSSREGSVKDYSKENINTSKSKKHPQQNQRRQDLWSDVDEQSRVLTGSGVQRISFPREWDQMLPDRADVIKESWKYAWRRIVFYVFLFALFFYLRNFPGELEVRCNSRFLLMFRLFGLAVQFWLSPDVSFVRFWFGSVR